MTISRMLWILVAVVAVASCQSDPRRTKVGEVAVAGLLEAHIGGDKGQLAPTAPGTLLSPYSGTDAGKSLNRADRSYAENTARESLTASPDGQTSRWSNPDNTHAGTFTPINAYRSADDLHCRDYMQSVTIGGQTQQDDGTACRADDGSWRIVETPARRSTGRERRQ